MTLKKAIRTPHLSGESEETIRGRFDVSHSLSDPFGALYLFFAHLIQALTIGLECEDRSRHRSCSLIQT